MKVFYYSVSFRNCNYSYTEKRGYTIANTEEEARAIIKEEYDVDDFYIEERKVIEIN